MAHCKFYRQKRQIYLNGIWIDTGETRKGDFYENDSFDCGYIAEEWRVSGYVCDDTTKYEQEVKYISNNGVTWTATTETRRGAFIESDSFDCGYIAEEWRVTGTMCDNLNKYYQETKYISDNGQTWTATTETRRGDLIEEHSPECLDPSLYKAIFYVYDFDTHGIKDIIVYPCDGDTVLRNYPKIESGSTNSYYKVSVGNCITEIADAAFDHSIVYRLDLPENGNLTRIGGAAFSNSGLGNREDYSVLNIPDSVTSIGNQAFDCVHIDEYHFGSGLTSIGHTAFDRARRGNNMYFSGVNPPTFGGNVFGDIGSANMHVPCGSEKAYDDALRSVNATAADTIWINAYAAGCTGLRYRATYSDGKVYEQIENERGNLNSGDTHPSGYTYLNLTSVEMDDSIKVIGAYAFSHCPLTSFTISDNVTIIANYAFRFGILNEVTIGSGITSIGYNAFSDNNSITSVTINAITPPSQSDSFNQISNLKIYVPCESEREYKLAWSQYADKITCTDLPHRWVTIQGSYECSGTTKITQEKMQVSYDGGETWEDSNPLITRSGSTVISYKSFECGYEPSTPVLATLTLNDGATTIAEGSGSTELTREMYGEYSARTVSVETTIDCKSIGDYAFRYYTGITSIEMSNSVTSIGEWAFYGCKSLTSINIPSGVTSIGRLAFNGCSSLTSIDIPSGVTSIESNVFAGCSSLISIDIPSGVTSIGGYAFWGCSSLISIDIPSGVTSIGTDAFANCYSLTSITIPDSVTVIDSYVFEKCSGLTSVTIPSVVTNINEYAFNGCQGLQSITCLATTPPTLGRLVFVNTNNCPIYVPAASVNGYKAANGWKDYKTRIRAIPT